MRIRNAAVLALLVITASACGSSGSGSSSGSLTLHLGYFANLTHAPAIIGLRKGFFANELGPAVEIDAKVFNAGPDVVQAIFSDALDVAYIGPNPAINAWAKSKGKAIEIIAGSTSGGAALVVKPGITSAAQLRGKTIASPQLGNTQDVALRTWLKSQGLNATKTGGGDVIVKPQPNAETLETFRAGEIDGAWVPEPWATRLQLEGGGKVLVDEASLWPGGKFVTTHVIVRSAFLRAHPDVVAHFLVGHLDAIDFANASPAEAQALVNGVLKDLTGKALRPATIAEAWKRLTFTADPIASSLRQSARNAESVGLLEPVDLNGIYDVGPLNAVLSGLHRPTITVV
jgi:NitT/TauT family transport system substrate-binding protein